MNQSYSSRFDFIVNELCPLIGDYSGDFDMDILFDELYNEGFIALAYRGDYPHISWASNVDTYGNDVWRIIEQLDTV